MSVYQDIDIKDIYVRMFYIILKFNKDMIIAEILDVDRNLASILMASGMHCIGCPSAQGESLEEACMVHGIDVEEVVGRLNEYLELNK